MSIASSVNKRGKKAEEIHLVATGSVLTNIKDDHDVRKLIHDMMELDEGTTIETIYLECMRKYQEHYFNMKPNEWRHLVRDYVKNVTQRQDLQDDVVFTFKSSIA